jgi:hypothetical protein
MSVAGVEDALVRQTGNAVPVPLVHALVPARFLNVGNSCFANMAEFDFPALEIRDDNQVSAHRGDDRSKLIDVDVSVPFFEFGNCDLGNLHAFREISLSNFQGVSQFGEFHGGDFLDCRFLRSSEGFRLHRLLCELAKFSPRH